MRAQETVYLGIDCGATTSKVAGVDAAGRPLANRLRQAPTRSSEGAAAIIEGWMEGVCGFMAEHGLRWEQVGGVGLAIPGPYRGYGVLGPMPNMPKALDGWRFLDELSAAVEQAAGRTVRVVTANDGLLAGVAEARLLQRDRRGSVLMLAPGSGLGCSFVDAEGRLLHGDHQAAVILCHMPAPCERLGLPAYPCGCGRDWGCFEAYTTIAGLPRYPEHELARSAEPVRAKALSLRGRAQAGDALALEIFDKQAQALGYAAAAGCMAYDPSHVVIGGGLMDPEATGAAFRKRYLDRVQGAAAEYLWVDPAELAWHQARLGELSQAIGAALLSQSA